MAETAVSGNPFGSHDDEQIIHDVRDGVARITFNRPDVANSLTAAQREQLVGWLAEASEDHDIRCVVINATGRFFCTGADLRQPGIADGQANRLVGDVRRTMLRGALTLMNALLDCEKPVIAAVQGTAAGIGAHLAFACDLVVAAEQAKFIEIFTRRGIAVDGLGAWLLPRLVGLMRAKELVLLAEDIPARRAYDLGLITRVVAADDLRATVDDLASRIAAGPTKALGASKWLLNRSLDLDRHSMAEQEAWVVEALSRTEDASEGVASYAERRRARFQGR